MKQTPEALRSRIYKLAESRIEAAGAKMPCSAALFEALAAQRPDSVDYTLLKDLDNRDFIEAAFSLLLGRPLDDATRAAWQDRTDSMPQEQFRTAVLRSVLRSPEYQLMDKFFPRWKEARKETRQICKMEEDENDD